jgi:ferredoxin-fold anticodon binding domain-containing protein
MDAINLIGLSARGEFTSYSNRFFYGTIAKIIGDNITIKGSVGKGKYKKIKYYAFNKNKVRIYKNG